MSSRLTEAELSLFQRRYVISEKTVNVIERQRGFVLLNGDLDLNYDSTIDSDYNSAEVSYEITRDDVIVTEVTEKEDIVPAIKQLILEDREEQVND